MGKQDKQNKNRKQGQFALVMKRMLQNKSAVIGMSIIACMAVIAILSPWIMPYKYDAPDVLSAFSGPSKAHWFGTDDLGRDIFSRIIYGARYSLSLGLLACGFSAIVGVIFGSIAGYFGGKTDMIIMRIMDVLGAIPSTLLAVCIAATLGTGYVNCIFALGVSGVPAFARLMRASLLNVSNLEYVEAAKSINCSNPRIILKYAIPNALAPVIVQTTMGIAHSLISAAALSYIGLGIQLPTPEWGAMLSGGRNYIRDYPHLVLAPGIAIMITVLSMNLIGDALRDAMDPKLKK